MDPDPDRDPVLDPALDAALFVGKLQDAKKLFFPLMLFPF
jgi:hypothetical protein